MTSWLKGRHMIASEFRSDEAGSDSPGDLNDVSTIDSAPYGRISSGIGNCIARPVLLAGGAQMDKVMAPSMSTG